MQEEGFRIKVPRICDFYEDGTVGFGQQILKFKDDSSADRHKYRKKWLEGERARENF